MVLSITAGWTVGMLVLIMKFYPRGLFYFIAGLLNVDAILIAWKYYPEQLGYVVAILLTLDALIFTLFVRPNDVPAPEPVSPTQHLDERKAEIYDSLRDLQFEYRLGKLSDGDYQKSKLGLQAELAKVLAEADRIRAELPVLKAAAAKPALIPVPKVEAKGTTCPHCGATFERVLKFCGECGKAMS